MSGDAQRHTILTLTPTPYPQREQLPPRLEVDIRESPTQFEIDASCPGVAKEDATVEVNAARHELYIRIAKAGRDEKDQGDGSYTVRGSACERDGKGHSDATTLYAPPPPRRTSRSAGRAARGARCACRVTRTWQRSRRASRTAC